MQLYMVVLKRVSLILLKLCLLLQVRFLEQLKWVELRAALLLLVMTVILLPLLPDRTIDPCAVEEFFALGYIAEPRTIYRNVRQLPAGTTLTIRRGQPAEMKAYWDPSPSVIDDSELKNLDEALLVETCL